MKHKNSSKHSGKIRSKIRGKILKNSGNFRSATFCFFFVCAIFVPEFKFFFGAISCCRSAALTIWVRELGSYILRDAPKPGHLKAPGSQPTIKQLKEARKGNGAPRKHGPSHTQKKPRVRKIFVRNSGAGNGCANFMDAWKKASILQEKECP